MDTVYTPKHHRVAHILQFSSHLASSPLYFVEVQHTNADHDVKLKVTRLSVSRWSQSLSVLFRRSPTYIYVSYMTMSGDKGHASRNRLPVSQPLRNMWQKYDIQLYAVNSCRAMIMRLAVSCRNVAQSLCGRRARAHPPAPVQTHCHTFERGLERGFWIFWICWV